MLSDYLLAAVLLMALIEVGDWVFHVDRKWMGGNVNGRT